MKRSLFFSVITFLMIIIPKNSYTQAIHNFQISANLGVSYTMGFTPGTPTPVLLAPLDGSTRRFAYLGGIFGFSLSYIYLYDTSRTLFYSDSNKGLKLRNTNTLVYGVDVRADMSIGVTGGAVSIDGATFNSDLIKTSVGSMLTFTLGQRRPRNLVLFDIFGLGFSTTHVHFRSDNQSIRETGDGSELTMHYSLPGIQVIDNSGFTYSIRNRISFISSSIELEDIIGFDFVMGFGYTFSFQ